MRLIAMLLFVSCATASPAPPGPTGETQEQSWKRARIIEAAVNGCVLPCPADALCVDEYGLCFTPCAWERSSEAMRALLHMAALDADPTRSFLMSCPKPPGALEAHR